MKKTIGIITLTLLCIATLGAQSIIGGHTILDKKGEPKDGYRFFDIQSKQSYIISYWTNNRYFSVIDPNTYKEKHNFKFKEPKGYEDIELGAFMTYEWALKNNIVQFYHKKDPKTKKSNIYGIKISETTTVMPEPEKMFAARETGYIVKFKENEAADRFLVTDPSPKGITYRLYNSDLKQLAEDSITSATNGGDTVVALHMNEGFAIVTYNTKGRDVRIHDVLKNETVKFRINNTKKVPMITCLKRIGDKVILCGNYFSRESKKKITNGVFKMVYDLNKRAVAEEYYFDHVPQGEMEVEELEKTVADSYITPNGYCYVVICQAMSGKISSKYELMGLGNNSDKFRKQLPITSFNDNMWSINNTIYFSEWVCTKFDINNFVYENRYIELKGQYELDRDTKNYIMKVGPDGYIRKSVTKPNDKDEPAADWLKFENVGGTGEKGNESYRKKIIIQ